MQSTIFDRANFGNNQTFMTIEKDINRSNLLGEVRAEYDHEMLDIAFYEWQGYKSLIETDDRFVVVGRRGTGKSAITYKLMKDCEAKKDFVVSVTPNEEEFLGLRVVAARYGTTVSRVRSAIKIGWRYALMMEVASKLKNHYKTSALIAASSLNNPLKEWEVKGNSIIRRLRLVLNDVIYANERPEESISELSIRLKIDEISDALNTVISSLNKRIVILIDRLDEGYEPDDIGIVDGIIYGTDELRNKLTNVKTVLLLRDNIFRAIQSSDQDFSRNIEGNVLRLHWDIQELFYLVCNRLRVGLKLDIESNTKLWNQVTEAELHGQEGFRKCLQLTLYRPRDIVSLLNNAFINAKKQERKVLINDDLKASSKHISDVRLDDLDKEYASVFPGIGGITKAFSGHTSKLSLVEAIAIIDSFKQRNNLDAKVVQHLVLLETSEEVLKALYSVGFLGLLDKASGNYIFCHDGRKPENTFSEVDWLLIHPCYWTALNMSSDILDPNSAQEIYDEYEITIVSQSKEMRDKKIGQIISELQNIDLGETDAHIFEDWCKRVLEFIFAGRLTNIQTRPNNNAASRRDVVATNEGLEGFWLRVLKDYNTRQVVFEVKNFEKLTINEYRQVNSYLGKEYGNCGFIICRDKLKELSKGAELDAFREFYNKNSMILKLTADFLVSILHKTRSPQKFDIADELLKKHLDEHIRLYASGQTNINKKKNK